MKPPLEYEFLAATESAVSELKRQIASRNLSARILLCSHVEVKLASWAVMFHKAGIQIAVSPCNPHTTRTAAVEYLKANDIPLVDLGCPLVSRESLLAGLRDFQPNIVFDDGGAVISRLAHHWKEGFDLAGAVEFTTSGRRRLLELPQVQLPWPVLDMSMSFCKQLANFHGTGISTLLAISYATNIMINGKHLLIIGYGSVGQGVANAARNLGAYVTVADNDRRLLLKAHCDGYGIGPLKSLLQEADCVVTCTGCEGVLSSDNLQLLPDNAIVTNVGCYREELELRGLQEKAVQVIQRSQAVDTYVLPDGKRIHVVADGEIINLAIGRGWPTELIDLCFTVATLCFGEIVCNEYEPGVHVVPLSIEDLAIRDFLSIVG